MMSRGSGHHCEGTDTITTTRDKLLDRILAWAEPRSDIRALAVVGSAARRTPPPDAWSDLDLVLVVRDPGVYLDSADWIAEIGPFSVHTVERISGEAISERRVLFKSGIDVDFIVLSQEDAQRGLQHTWIGGIVTRGIRVLLDKDDLLPSPESSAPHEKSILPPSQQEFLEVVNDFWFQLVWAAKKLRRGELWSAKSCADVHMKHLLLRMVGWHANAREGWDLDTWYGGRFIERWASADVVGALSRTYAHYDEDDIWRALFASSGLFLEISKETAQHLDYDYPEEAQREAVGWAEKYQSERPDVSKGDSG